MSTFLPEDVRKGLEAARKRDMKRKNRLRVGDGKYDSHVGVLSRGNKGLVAVEDVMVPVEHRSGLEGGGVTARFLLAQPGVLDCI